MANQDARQEIRDRLGEAVREGRLPDWAAGEPPVEARQALREQMQGSHDVASAAEALIDEGDIVYDQATPRDLQRMANQAGLPTGFQADEDATRYEQELGRFFMGNSGASDAPFAVRGNCYEFVHLAAFVAADEDGHLHSGNHLRNAIDPDSLKEWDFESPIPRGSVIVGCVAGFLGGQGADNTYHFAISLGDGMVANNRDQGAKKESLEDVFGGVSLYRLPGGKVYYGDYACYADKSVTPAVAPGVPAGKVPNPRSAKEMRSVGVKGAIGVTTTLFIAVVVAILLSGNGSGAGDAAGRAQVAASGTALALAAVADTATPSPTSTSLAAADDDSESSANDTAQAAPTDEPTEMPPTEELTVSPATPFPTNTPETPVPTNTPTPEPILDPSGSYNVVFNKTESASCAAYPATQYGDGWEVTVLSKEGGLWNIRIRQLSNNVDLTGTYDPAKRQFMVQNQNEAAIGLFTPDEIQVFSYTFDSPQCPQTLEYIGKGPRTGF